MIRLAFALGVAAFAFPANGQIFPVPSAESPRIQEATWEQGRSIALTALPETNLTVLLEPGQIIRRATISDSDGWTVTISADQDSLSILPAAGARPANLTVETDTREYLFSLETTQSLLAAYLVRLSPQMDETSEIAPQLNDSAPRYSYRLRGDRSVRPAAIADDGEKTVIEYAAGQALPAVFAIGPSGDEEVVDGYMRGDKFVIDRVHQELVFRIDKEKATARRNRREDEAS